MPFKVVSQILTENSIIELVDQYINDEKRNTFISERPRYKCIEFNINEVTRFEGLTTNVQYEQRYDIHGIKVYYEDHMRSCQLGNLTYKISLKDGEVKSVHKWIGGFLSEVNYRNLPMMEMIDISKLALTYTKYFETTRFYSGKTLHEEYLDKLKNEN